MCSVTKKEQLEKILGKAMAADVVKFQQTAKKLKRSKRAA